MTREMKRPTSHISQNSIKPVLSKAVEFYTDNNRQAYECIHERDEYIDYLESKLSNARPQQALPVVPERVAEFIDESKGNLSLYGALFFICDNTNKELNNWVFREANQNLFARAWLEGYTVEKPQLFYLKNKIELEEVGSDLIGYLNLFLTNGGYLTNNINRAKKFTKQEIDSMQTGSYELVPVEDGE